MDLEVLKRIRQVPFSRFYTTWPYHNLNNKNVRKAIKQYWRNDILRYQTPIERLNRMTVVEIKELLKMQSFKISGKKSVLIDRAMQNDVMLNSISQSIRKDEYIELSTHGQDYFSWLQANKITDYENLVLNVILLVHQLKFNNAYKNMCYYEKLQFFQIGININWEEEFKRGLSDLTQNLYTLFLKSFESSELSFLTIAYAILAGRNDLDRIIEKYLIEEKKTFSLDEIKHSWNILVTMKQLLDYREVGMKKYKILKTCDNLICPFCKAVTDEPLEINNCVIGENAPPFHFGCRCSITLYWEGLTK